MDAVTKPRNVAIFDDWKHCVAYVPQGTKVKITDHNPAFLGLWADKEYTQVDWNGQTGYILKEALEVGNDAGH